MFHSIYWQFIVFEFDKFRGKASLSYLLSQILFYFSLAVVETCY